MQSRNKKSRKILVVEDEPTISRVCSQTLTGEGFKVDIANNGSIAEDMIEDKEYDLLLIDIRTPVMNGRELYQWINERHPELGKQVIFTTGELLGSVSEKFVEQSGRPFLPKPFTPDILRAVVKEAFKRIGK
jgi:DNA-binding response OmpR family regulator